jgi:hypothetical protein
LTGQASNAASLDAANGTIVVANIFDTNGTPGSVTLCKLNVGCNKNLKNAAMYKVAGVALDTRGNCWASAEQKSGAAVLVYFAGCAGSGKVATGFMNTDYGDLMFDRTATSCRSTRPYKFGFIRAATRNANSSAARFR